MRRLNLNLLPAAALSAWLLAGCASAPAPAPMEDAAKPALDRVLARMISKGELDKAIKLSDSVMASRDNSEREIASYWKAVAYLYKDEPDSAAAVLEAQGKWTAGLRKVHGALLLKLARESTAARASHNWRPDEPPRPAPAADKGLQDRVEALQKESSDLRAENQRLETEKEKYQKLLKDLETIR